MKRRRSWTVPGIVLRVLDGDTNEADLDLGWNVWMRTTKIRLAGVNCPEMNTAAGKIAAARTRELCPVGAEVLVMSHSLDKYGRVLGNVLMGAELRDLAGVLLAEGLAVDA